MARGGAIRVVSWGATGDPESLVEAEKMQQPIRTTRGEDVAAAVNEACAKLSRTVDRVKQFRRRNNRKSRL